MRLPARRAQLYGGLMAGPTRIETASRRPRPGPVPGTWSPAALMIRTLQRVWVWIFYQLLPPGTPSPAAAVRGAVPRRAALRVSARAGRRGRPTAGRPRAQQAVRRPVRHPVGCLSRNLCGRQTHVSFGQVSPVAPTSYPTPNTDWLALRPGRNCDPDCPLPPQQLTGGDLSLRAHNWLGAEWLSQGQSTLPHLSCWPNAGSCPNWLETGWWVSGDVLAFGPLQQLCWLGLGSRLREQLWESELSSESAAWTRTICGCLCGALLGNFAFGPENHVLQ